MQQKPAKRADDRRPRAPAENPGARRDVLLPEQGAGPSAASPSPVAPVVLTRRESQCLHWLAEGKSSWDIGKILGLSVSAVNGHISRLCRKLGTSSRLVAALRASRLGLLPEAGGKG